jgi:hypothetical protein
MTFDFTTQLTPVFWTMVALVALPAVLIARSAWRMMQARAATARTTVDRKTMPPTAGRQPRPHPRARLPVEGRARLTAGVSVEHTPKAVD